MHRRMCRRIHSGIVRLDSQRRSCSCPSCRHRSRSDTFRHNTSCRTLRGARGVRPPGGVRPLPVSSPVELRVRATVRGARARVAVAPSQLMRALVSATLFFQDKVANSWPLLSRFESLQVHLII